MKLSSLWFPLAMALVIGLALATAGVAAPPRVPADAVVPAQPQIATVAPAAWGSTAQLGGPLAARADEVVIHHFWRPALNAVAPATAEAALLRQVERAHVGNGWSGLAYNFVVFQSGRVYEVRGWDREGAHTKGVNAHSVGIAFAIDGDRVRPSPAAWQAAKDLIEDGVALGHLEPDVVVSGHRDHAPKSCPGELVAPHLHELVPHAA